MPRFTASKAAGLQPFAHNAGESFERIILKTMRSSLDKTTNPRAREKLHWLQAEVEAGLNSLADPRSRQRRHRWKPKWLRNVLSSRGPALCVGKSQNRKGGA